MITVNIMGGLGNQLFQIFAAISCALEHNHEFIFPYSYRLDEKRVTHWDNFLIHLKKYTSVNLQCDNFIHLNCSQNHYVDISGKEQIDNPNKNIKLFGYFPSHRYFEKHENEIYEMMKLDEIVNDVKNELSFYLPKDKHIVSLHFRRGDYVFLQNYHNLLGYDYYENALNHIVDNIKGQHIVVNCFAEQNDNFVTETIAKLKNRFHCNFVLIPQSIPDWKQMLLMSCCNSFIIANSTFSWWGAYFCKTPYIICYPSVWFGPANKHLLTHDMFPSTWHKIDCK